MGPHEPVPRYLFGLLAALAGVTTRDRCVEGNLCPIDILFRHAKAEIAYYDFKMLCEVSPLISGISGEIRSGTLAVRWL